MSSKGTPFVSGYTVINIAREIIAAITYGTGDIRKYTDKDKNVSQGISINLALRTLTKDKTTCTEETVHGVQSPPYNFLEVRSSFSNKEVEGPVRSGRKRDSLCAHGQWENLGNGQLLKLPAS